MAVEISFNKLGLPKNILSALTELGYENPTPIQEKTIPILLEGHDILAQAQTGTGKTAAFSLPILTQLEPKLKKPQALIITPTRELALQVAEALQSYAKHIKGFQVAPIYGGQDYQIQLRLLKHGAQVIVGTPGRIMEHLRRRTLATNDLRHVVLDEADEMLKMGFIEDIEWILEQIPSEYQTALFSATLPTSIQKIARRYLHEPQKITIKQKKNTTTRIEQSYILVNKEHKLATLTRLLEIEELTAAIIFTRTKNGSDEIAEKLQARGFTAAAMNGNMNQSLRQKTIDRLKDGRLDIIVATDVAARGIDIERISHVINFDIPHDTEAYIHRIGRTGRAGRQGKALLFVTPREQRLFNNLQHSLPNKIKKIDPPSQKAIQQIRDQRLAEKVQQVIIKKQNNKTFYKTIQHLMQLTQLEAEDIGAALIYLQQEEAPSFADELPEATTSRATPKPHNKRKKSKKSDKAFHRGKPKPESRNKRPKKSSNRRTARSHERV